jgi:hypothetical protein
MDEMKQASEIDNGLREVAKQRDKLLSTVPALSPKRRAVLTEVLVVEFPVEAALRETATRRDQLLNPCPPEIPASAESTLHRQLLAAEPARGGARGWRASDWRISASIWLKIFRSPPGPVLTACAMITVAILCFGRWGTPSRRNAAETLPHIQWAARVNLESGVISDHSPIGRAELFNRKTAIGPFNLNTSEPASLQATFVANSRIYFTDGVETPLGLSLNLPVTAIFSEDGLARTP